MTDPAALPLLLDVWQQTLNWQPNATQLSQFQSLYQQILEGNRHLNLTRITDPQEFWEKHLWDSLLGIQPWLAAAESDDVARSPDTSAADSSHRVIDIGTGAGFPGVPVAIAYPDWTITLLDSTRKKMAFLASLLTTLKLPNATALVDRVEQLARRGQHRAAYDLALVRAVAAAPVCAEYAIPLLKVGGTAVLYRGQWTAADTIALQPALTQLGATLEQVQPAVTPLTNSVRHCLYLKKLAPTPPVFPRPVGVALRSPL